MKFQLRYIHAIYRWQIVTNCKVRTIHLAISQKIRVQVDTGCGFFFCETDSGFHWVLCFYPSQLWILQGILIRFTACRVIFVLNTCKQSEIAANKNKLNNLLQLQKYIVKIVNILIKTMSSLPRMSREWKCSERRDALFYLTQTNTHTLTHAWSDRVLLKFHD